jgi:hypothetical protein
LNLQPDWLKADILANKLLGQLKAKTTEGAWYPEEDQDGEYTGPGDIVPGYAGEYFKTGAVVSDQSDHDAPSPCERAVEVFDAARNRNRVSDAEWVSAAHNDDASARYDRLVEHCLQLGDKIIQLQEEILRYLDPEGGVS